MGANETIDARPETVGSLLTFSSTPKAIDIPVYQRFYQWDKAKVIDLLKLSDPDSRDFGFIGTMVFVQNAKGSLEVVDGQQRLLSLILVFCAMRDYIADYVERVEDKDTREMLEDMRRDIQAENLIVKKKYSSIQDNPRIIFKRSTYKTFKEKYLVGNSDYVTEEEVYKTELNHFQNNYLSAKEYLHVKYDDKKGSDVVRLLNMRVERLKALVINAIYITNPDNAGEVFESINGTGVILKLSELVKNYILRSIDSPTALARWDEIELNAGKNTTLIEKIIKYDWQNIEDISDDFEIFRSIKTNVKDASQYLDRIVRVSRIFKFYTHPSNENFKYLKITDNRNDKQHLIKIAATLEMIKVRSFLRTIIALDPLLEYLNINEYLNILTSIHNFQIRAKISSTATNEIDRIYTRYGKRLNKIKLDVSEKGISGEKEIHHALMDVFADLKNDLFKASPNDIFKNGFVGFTRTKSTGKDFFKYLLGAIENRLQTEELIIDTKDNQITLEEIYPQEPTEEWQVCSDLTKDDIYKFCNATILKGKDNGAGSNKVIAGKYPIFKASKLALNRQLVEIIDNNQGEWNKNALEIRASTLADVAESIWRLH